VVILDTCILIDHLRLAKSAPKEKSLLYKVATEVGSKNLAFSILSIQELFAGESVSDPREHERVLNLTQRLQILPYNYKTAYTAGRITKTKSYALNFADAGIAATALINDYSLFTLNEKHFQTIPHLQLYKI